MTENWEHIKNKLRLRLDNRGNLSGRNLTETRNLLIMIQRYKTQKDSRRFSLNMKWMTRVAGSTLNSENRSPLNPIRPEEGEEVGGWGVGIVPAHVRPVHKKACPDCARQLLSNFWHFQQLFSVQATLSNFWFSEQLLSNFDQIKGFQHARVNGF